MKNYIRSERPNLFEPNDYISMVIEISGDVSKTKLRHAIECTYQANQTTMSRIVLEEDGQAYYEAMEQTGCKCILSNEPWQKLLLQSEKEPFALNEGELMRTFVTEEGNRTIVFIHAHHLAGDGKSMVDFIQDTFLSMDGKQLVFKPMLSVDHTYLEKRAKLQWGMKKIIKRINQKWKKTGTCFTWEDYYAIHRAYWKKYHSEIEWNTLDAEYVKKSCAKDTTVNSCLIGMLLQEHPEYKRIGIPVSIREESRGMSNQTSGVEIVYRFREKLSFEDNVKNIHKAIYKRINNQNMKYFVLMFEEKLSPSLIDAILLQTHDCYRNKISKRMAKVMGYMGDRTRDLGVSNLNRIEIPIESETYQVERVIFIPPKVSYAKQIVGVCTYQNEMVVCRHYMRKQEGKFSD